MTALHTLHKSMRHQVIRRIPRGMSAINLPDEIHTGLAQIALDVFTDCINAGMPMQDALLAVYMTGIENGKEAFLVAHSTPRSGRGD